MTKRGLFEKKKRNNFHRIRRSIRSRYSEAKGSSSDVSDAMREQCVIKKEIKGLCLCIQFKAYCPAFFEGRRVFKGRRRGSTIENTGFIKRYSK
jgi:hypothetical protein